MTQLFPDHFIRPFMLLNVGILFILLLMAISVGSVAIPLTEVVQAVWQSCCTATNPDTNTHHIIITLVRAPRAVVGACVGAALAIAGVQMQGLFKNPLASPSIVGISSGGALGAVLALATGAATYSVLAIPGFAFLGAFMTLFIIYFLATQHGHTAITTLLLAGVALSALLSALISFVITLSSIDLEVSREMIFWLMGGLGSRTWLHVYIILPCLGIGFVVSLYFHRELDIMLMGQETAHSLGVDVQKVKWLLLTGTALLTGAAVAVSGVIGFVGLVIPHITRLLIGPKHRYLLPCSALIGANFVLLMDMLARTARPPEEISLGVLTALVGAPFFLYLLVHHRKEVGYQ